MIILRAADEAIQSVLTDYLLDILGDDGMIDVYLADESETKRQMPYIRFNAYQRKNR